MKLGFALPNIGSVATADSIIAVAQSAEALGYSSLWTVERLLYPVKPQVPYPATPDGALPVPYKHVLDPIETLTFAAAYTKSIHFGVSVLDIPYYNPVTLGRRLTTLDVLSHGRLRVGFGLGWSKDEMQATNADMKTRGAMADEFLQVLKAIWTSDPVEFKGKFFSVPKSYISVKPVQKPHPPIYLAAFAPPALKRLAAYADGWNPVGMTVDAMEKTFDSIRDMAKDAGRDPGLLKMIVRANIEVTDKPLPQNRFIFTGTFDQIKLDIAACRNIGAAEVFLDPTFSSQGQTLDHWLAVMEELAPAMHSELIRS